MAARRGNLGSAKLLPATRGYIGSLMYAVRYLAAFVAMALPAICATFGTVVPRAGGYSDIVLDQARRRLYVVSSSSVGAGGVEVYSTAANPPRLAGGLIRTAAGPVAAAMSRSGALLYVTCSQASSLDIIDLERLTVSNRISLPASPEGVAVGGDDR